MRKLLIMSLALLATIMLSSPIFAGESGGSGGKVAINADSGGSSLGQGKISSDVKSTAITTGFKWGHCTTTHHGIGSSRSYCLFDFYGGDSAWIWTSDNKGEDVLIACAESNHWCGIYINKVSGSTFTWTYVRIWKY